MTGDIILIGSNDKKLHLFAANFQSNKENQYNLK